MKKIFNLAICVLALMFASCEEEAPATSRKVETGKVSEIRLTSATFHGIVNVDISQYNTVTFGIMLSESKAELNERGGEMFKAKALIGKDFELQINNLSSETKYYYCAWLFLNGTQYEFGDIKEFETLAPSPATVITNPITKIMTNSAVAGGCVKDDGGASVTERGVVYSTSKEPTTSNYKVKSGSGVGEFTCNLTNLQDNAIYYVRAYGINSKGTVYGEERYFTTKEITLPSVYTSNVTDIAYTSASIRGNVTNDGNAEVTERGIVYSTTQNPTTSNTKKRNGSGTGSFTCNLTDLQDGVSYYVRAYATNLKGTAYGEEKSFTTKTINLPTVSTLAASDISFTSATVGGNVSDDGGGNVNERGIVYSTSKEPTTSNNKVKNGSGNGSFSCDLTGLQDGVTYYVRAYATNLKGTAYGEEKSFTTKTINLPTVSTTTASNISYTSATVGGNVSNDGGANVTERGIVYSTLKEPTISNNKVKNGSGNGSFSCDLSNLQDGVTYYVRAYAINLKGTAYGEEKSFTTKTINLPTVSTSVPSNISYTSAEVGCKLINDGGAYVTELGVVYSTSQEPTISNNKVKTEGGSGIIGYHPTLSNLQDGVTYYVRAYAINLKGIAYGEEKSFTTKTINLPTVSTLAASDISSTSATVNGNVSDDGGANVTERGIVYSTLKEPTISNNRVKNGSGNGSFSCDLSNLQDGVTYYVRAYAINLKGTAYGAEISFSTPKRLLENGYEYIDLGLSVKWATCNVGATKPEDYGDYFAWGETQPKDYYDWSTYKWCRGSENTHTKYCTNSYYGTVDNKTVLDLSDDAARANWGGSWRMPTTEEQQELINNCSWIWTNQNGVTGYKVVSYNGNSIFLPAAGYCNDSSLFNVGSYGYYWSSSLNTANPYGACYSLLKSSNVNYFGSFRRCYGVSVRPVCQ